jgi:heptosyltransferase-2
MKRLLIVAPNWLGDAVMALPAIDDIRRRMPDWAIVVAARRSVAPLFTLVAGVNEVVAQDGHGRIPTTRAETNGGPPFDAALLLPNSFRSALAVARAGVPERWGYRANWRRLLLTRAVTRPAGRLHQVDYYQHLVRGLGVPTGAGRPRVDVPPALGESGACLLRGAGWDGRSPLVAIAPGAAFGPAKRWPAASFAELAVGLGADSIATVLVGAAADASIAAEVTRGVSGRVPLFDLVGKTDIPALAGVLINCRAAVANDSGAIHLAAAVGIPVTAVFGPTDERLTAPRGAIRRPDVEDAEHAPRLEQRGHTVLTNQVWCRPCMLRACPIDHACMRGIGVGRVLDAARRSV